MFAFLAPYKLFIYIGIIITLFGSTYIYAQHRQKVYDENKYAVEKMVIKEAADKAFNVANEKAAIQDKKFSLLQQEMEKKIIEDKATNDLLRKRIATSGKLRDPYSKPTNCSKVSTDSSATSQPVSEAPSSELSTEFTGFLRELTFQADETALYANTCYEWATKIGQ